jgi:serine/threonine protein phosphatase 1
MMVKRYPINKLGRDFVIGDIHGAYDLVIQAMRAVKFNKLVDRLFGTGDLIDRGEGSARANEFLDKEYVHCIRGNHDDDFCSLDYQTMMALGEINLNGLGWVTETSKERLMSLKEKISKLPFVMEVETRRGKVGFVHADIPKGMDWQTFVSNIENGDQRTISIALQGRNRVNNNDVSGVKGIDRVFVGHTIQWNGVKQMGNIFVIDTGAVFNEIDGARGFATMVNLNCVTSELVKKESVQPIQSFVLRNIEGQMPFSKLESSV